MYGSSPKRRSKSQTSKQWSTKSQSNLSQEYKQMQREESRMIKMKEDLELRRAIRHSRGKYEDTEAMLFAQAKINRYNRATEAKKMREEAEHKQATKLLKWYLILSGAILLATSLWWIYVACIALLLIKRRQQTAQQKQKYPS